MGLDGATKFLAGGVVAAMASLLGVAHAQAVAPVEGLRRIDVRSAGQPRCSLEASLDVLPSGGETSSMLTWTSSGAVRVTLNGGEVDASGSLAVRPLADAAYTLVAHGAGGASSATCRQEIRVTQPACVDGAICAVSCGTGLIPDVRTGRLLALDPGRLVHVLILAEGYTSADLRRFHVDAPNDVSDWMDAWGRLEVFDTFREAFCFWKLPAVSNARIVAGGAVEDTAFRVPVDLGGEIDFSDPAATDVVEARVWAAVERLPFPPTTFYPTTAERTRGMAKNVVVATMVYEPARARSGFSGRTALLTNPSNAGRTVAAAFAHHRPHEFAHAFARLRDEYLDLDGDPACVPRTGAWTSANVSNVVCESGCGDVPWSHLVAGGAQNPAVQGLVGAFGHVEDGYHPELKCLMNGSRADNATVFGGEADLRTPGRMCNFCRELSAFRLFERIGALEDTTTSYATWQRDYRARFYEAYGLDVPGVVPMETPPGRPVFAGCTPP
ncbi:MAG TPA: hypothetical protein VF139_05555 [Candidatus Polarisedimenticolaceae bacterium]